MDSIIIAITGPSGAGKTTLGDLLIYRNGFVTPKHSTTRKQRNDDKKGFYRYLTHNNFKLYAINNKFLFWSGDNKDINPKYGNYYGILKKDYEDVKDNKKIIMFVSYKDIDYINYLKTNGYNIEIVNLLYNNIEENMPKRLTSEGRNHTQEEIDKRIRCAIDYEKRFGKILNSYDILKIQSDVLGIEETYDIVVKRLIKKV